MGSRSSIITDTKLAYIAGFLDGDGSLMFQLKHRSDSKIGLRFMATICFYQDTRHEKTLLWIQKQINGGYVSHRNDGMTELRMNGFSRTRELLEMLLPYIRFKQKQASALIKVCRLLEQRSIQKLSSHDIRVVIGLLLLIQNENYKSKNRKTKEELYRILGLTP